LLDLQKVDQALSRLVTKWPMLAGRLQRADVCLFIFIFQEAHTYLAEYTE
jgi:hypothetical protein